MVRAERYLIELIERKKARPHGGGAKAFCFKACVGCFFFVFLRFVTKLFMIFYD